jgi:amino acid adenylation domain-containing protein
MMRDAQPLAVLTHKRFKDRVAAVETTVIVLDDLSPASNSAQDVATISPSAPVRANHLAYVIYTSGSTGTPKGAMNEHVSVVNRLQWMQDAYGLTEHDKVLQKTPSSFDVSVWEFFWPLLNGARLVLARPLGHQDPRYLAKLIQEEAITVVHFVPSMLQAFLEDEAAPHCTSLVHIVCSGEELSLALQDRCLQMFPQAQLHNLYGPTEAAVDVTYWECRCDTALVRVPIGRPIANTRIYILDSQYRPVPIGVSGEIYIGGIAVGRGYLNRPAMTAEKFVADPFSAQMGRRMYRTGDVGRWREDGSIEYLGRNDHQVKIRGFRIELGEIESRLSRHPQVREAVVIALAEPGFDKRLVAYYTPAGDETISSEDLRDYLRKDLPEYMVPAAFVPLDAFPLTANGKLDRRALPAPARTISSKVYEPPQGELEETLAAIWQTILRIERVGRHDNFFELGGHSLSAIQLISRVRQALGREFALRELFQAPTIAGMSKHLSIDTSGLRDEDYEEGVI